MVLSLDVLPLANRDIDYSVNPQSLSRKKTTTLEHIIPETTYA